MSGAVGSVSGLNHVGVGTPDLDASITWYVDVLGLALLRGPVVVDDAEPSAPVHRDIFGAEFAGCRMAHLGLPDGTGIELFEFGGGVAVAASPFWRRSGLFHVALGCADVEATAALIESAGGRRLSAVHQTPRCTLCYCEDPFGTVLELVNRPYEETHSA